MALVTITYPPGCKEINDDVGTDELVRRLKQLANSFQQMVQSDDESTHAIYTPLALHITDEYFINNSSRDVQLLVACCIADILRIFAPDAPYKQPQQIKTIFMFLIKQLGGLRDPKDPAFKRYFYLLENLSYVKSFNMCFDLEEFNEICVALFTLMFKIVNDEHSGKVKNFILDVLTPLITDSDYVSNELLDIILQNIVEPAKSQRKHAHDLAKELVNKTCDSLEPYIQQFFNQVLILGKADDKLYIKNKVYDLIYELNHICPSVLLAVLPQLEFKLKSTVESERMGSVTLLARMFSEPNSKLAVKHRALWQAFLGRFNDISVDIRTKCVQHTMHFLTNHPELVDDITETLKLRQHDSEESVRYEVVIAIVYTAKKDFDVVSRSEDLLNFVKERTLDKKFKIRKEAMNGLAMIYHKHLSNPHGVPEATKNAVKWIKDKILHGYYMPGIDDRLLVERLLVTRLVPYSLETEDRMKKLLLLFSTIDVNASKAFIEIQKHQMQVRRSVSELINLQKVPPSEERNKAIALKNNSLSKFLPEPAKGLEFIKKLSQHMATDDVMLQLMEKLCEPGVSCKESFEATNLILKKLGSPIMTNLYYNTVKMLLERISSLLIDRDAIKALLSIVNDVLQGGDVITELGLDPDTAGEKGLRLLFVLSFIFPRHFMYRDVITEVLRNFKINKEFVPPLTFHILSFLGRHKPINETFPDLYNLMKDVCISFIRDGTPKDAKQAIKCLYFNTTENKEEVFSSVLDIIKANLNGEKNKTYLTAIVALGHFAFYLPDKFPVHIKNLVSRKIVKELIMQDRTPARGGTEEWCSVDDLCLETRCKLEGFKMMARWLLGLKTDEVTAQKTFRMLNAIIENGGDLLEEQKPNLAEKSWLRLGAGCAMLKICEQKGVGDQFTAEQFYVLSRLALDSVPQVREKFILKLHKGLGRGIPNKCLPMDFMGMYALAGFEQDKRLKRLAKDYMNSDISKRRDYVKTLLMTGNGESATADLSYILPDYMLVFAVAVITHDTNYTSHLDTEHLKRIRQALWFILEPLMTKNENYSFVFYQDMIQKMKNHKDAVNPEDDAVNCRMYAVCDLALGIISTRSTNFERKSFLAEPKIPSTYFKEPDNPKHMNLQIYVPAEMEVGNAINKKSALHASLISADEGESASDDIENGTKEPDPEPPKKRGRM